MRKNVTKMVKISKSLIQINKINVPFSIQSISLRDSASIGISFLIFISVNHAMISENSIEENVDFEEN